MASWRERGYFRGPMALKRYFIVLAMSAAAFMDAAGQAPRVIPYDHWSYEYIQRLQQRGMLLELNPTALPYTYAAVRRAIDAVDGDDLTPRERRWVRLLESEFRQPRIKRGRVVAGGEIVPGLRASSTERIDPLRPGANEGRIRPLGITLYPNASGRLFAEYGPFVAQGGLRFDLYYRDDPDALDAANRLIVRNEEAYVGFGSRYFTAHLGRLTPHWGVFHEPALLVSHNIVALDQLSLRLGGERLSMRSVVGELDSITEDGRFTGTAGADSVAGSVRRYVSLHRFDWRPSRHFTMSLMESTVYSGENTGFSLKFLNPLNIQAFTVDGRPKNDENNGILAGIIWANYRRVTLHGQLLIDDIDLMAQTGEALSAAFTGSIRYAGLRFGDLGGSLTAVTARAYNTHQPEGRYLHLLRGIGTQYNDYLHLSAFASWYLGRRALDVKLTPKLDLLFQGEQDIRLLYPGEESDLILDGTPERTLRPALEMRIQHGRRWWAHLDVGPAIVSDAGHVHGNERSLVTAIFSFGTRLGFTRTFAPML